MPATRRAVPALRRGLQVLRLISSRPAPMSAAGIARELGLARSTAYELLTELAAAGFVVHLPAERRWGLGVSAFEIGSAYQRGEPLERLGRPVIHRLAAAAVQADPGSGPTAHLGVLHGAEILYLIKDRAAGHAPTLVTDVGVRLPATLTATGLSLLAGLPTSQVRALFPGPAAFVRRSGGGPSSLPQLRADLRRVQQRGWATEHARVSPGTASVAAAAHDHRGHPLAAVGITCGHEPAADCSADGCAALATFVGPVLRAAAELTTAIGGRAADRSRAP